MISKTTPVPHLALTLASSELGFNVHTGFLDALTHEVGISPGHLGAVSSGSYVGGLYASGFETQEIRGILSSKEMIKSVIELKSPLRGVGMLFNLSGFSGIISGRNFASHLKKYLGDRCIEDCKQPKLSLAVTNLNKGCHEIVTKGPLCDFIVASCSVPGLFKCQKIGRYEYCDGAVCDSAPFYHFLEDPNIQSILVHIVRHTNRYTEDPRPASIASVFGKSHQIITDRFMDLTLECAQCKGKKVTIITSTVPRFRWGQRESHEILFQSGRQSVLKNLDQIYEAISSAKP
jgi:hypothetical protein